MICCYFWSCFCLCVNQKNKTKCNAALWLLPISFFKTYNCQTGQLWLHLFALWVRAVGLMCGECQKCWKHFCQYAHWMSHWTCTDLLSCTYKTHSLRRIRCIRAKWHSYESLFIFTPSSNIFIPNTMLLQQRHPFLAICLLVLWLHMLCDYLERLGLYIVCHWFNSIF